MGIETSPVLENESEDILLGNHEWKWLTDAIDRLEFLAAELEVTPLGDFCSYTREDALSSLDEEEVAEMEAEAELQDGKYILPEEGLLWSLEREWFAPEDGLKSAEALLDFLQKNPNYWDESDRASAFEEGLPYILGALIETLKIAQEKNKRFYLKTWV